MLDEDFKNLLDGAHGVVEANSFEYFALWQMNQLPDYPNLEWKENLRGRGDTVGFVDGRPVCISVRTAEIAGKKIVFWYATSQIVDYHMIDKWLEENMPESARKSSGYLNKTDATNFHNVLPRS